MKWELILDKVEEKYKSAVDCKIKEEWNKLKVDPTYQESTFWEGKKLLFIFKKSKSSIFQKRLQNREI